MDPRRFDDLSRSLASPRSRRGFIAGVAALTAAAVSGLRGSAQTGCPPGQTPNRKGECRCPAGTDACPDGCYDLDRDLANCGACGSTCIGGECRKGECKCPEGTELCDGACLDPATYPTDPNNCGTCGNVCVGGVCVDGACLAPNGFACAANAECISEVCTGGICCDRACDGSCESCVLTNSRGTCTALANGTACPGSGSGNRCENPATCAAGVCVDRAPVTCTQPPVGGCTQKVCEPTTGNCVDAPKSNGTACGQDKFCVRDQTCTNGVCGGGTEVVCNDPPQCQRLPGRCYEAAGPGGVAGCYYTAMPENWPCGDRGICSSGYCIECAESGVLYCPYQLAYCCSSVCHIDPDGPNPMCCTCA